MPLEVQLFLGGARSGKTRLAEACAAQTVLEPVYLATATAADTDMQERIARHRREREHADLAWSTVEEPLELGAAIKHYARAGRCLVVDCLTLWLSNCLHQKCWPQQRVAFVRALEAAQGGHGRGSILLVSNETGLGVVPLGALTREFVDQSGFLHQEIAGIADRVTLVVAGLPVQIK